MWRANRDGLIAVGGDLSVERLLLAYRSGIFPWPIYEEILTWFSPDPRAVLELDGLHVSRSLAKTIRRGRHEVRIDTAFEDVIARCAMSTDQRPSTWITNQVSQAFIELHKQGWAHSVETWIDGQLVGGLYGVAISGVFAGESMFSEQPNASKIALVALVERMRARGLSLLDVQVPNPHLSRLGATVIPRRIYIRRLRDALRADVAFV